MRALGLRADPGSNRWGGALNGPPAGYGVLSVRPPPQLGRAAAPRGGPPGPRSRVGSPVRPRAEATVGGHRRAAGLGGRRAQRRSTRPPPSTTCAPSWPIRAARSATAPPRRRTGSSRPRCMSAWWRCPSASASGKRAGSARATPRRCSPTATPWRRPFCTAISSGSGASYWRAGGVRGCRSARRRPGQGPPPERHPVKALRAASFWANRLCHRRLRAQAEFGAYGRQCPRDPTGAAAASRRRTCARQAVAGASGTAYRSEVTPARGAIWAKAPRRNDATL